MAERDLTLLFHAHAAELEAYLARQVRCRQTAADLLQDIFVRIAQQPPQAGERNLRSYLFRTAHNLAVDHHRREQRRQTEPVPTEALAGIAAEQPVPEEVADSRQRLALLRRCLTELPPRTREIFELNRIAGLTYGEIAARLGISESSVQKHLAQALYHAMQRRKELAPPQR